MQAEVERMFLQPFFDWKAEANNKDGGNKNGYFENHALICLFSGGN